MVLLVPACMLAVCDSNPSLFWQRNQSHTSASVMLLLPPKNGPASSNNGSISFRTASTKVVPNFSFSSPSAFMIWYIYVLTFPTHVSAKNAILALVNALVGLSLVAGQKFELGYMSAMKVLTIADSVTTSSCRMPLEILMLGTRPRGFIFRYHDSRGRSRSMITSSYGILRARRVMWVRWAQGQP